MYNTLQVRKAKIRHNQRLRIALALRLAKTLKDRDRIDILFSMAKNYPKR